MSAWWLLGAGGVGFALGVIVCGSVLTRSLMRGLGW